MGPIPRTIPYERFVCNEVARFQILALLIVSFSTITVTIFVNCLRTSISRNAFDGYSHHLFLQSVSFVW